MLRSAASRAAALCSRAAYDATWERSFKSVAKKVAVTLNEDIISLGHAGDVVRVSQGYAFNNLLPGKKAALVRGSKRQLDQALESSRRREAFVSESTAEARERRAVEAALDAVLRKVLTTTVKLRAPVVAGTSLTLEDGSEMGPLLTNSIGVEEVCDALREQARVDLHPRLVAPPPEGAITRAGEHELPLLVGFSAGQEGVLRVTVAPAAAKK